jgi:hypothetical protein
MTEYQNKNKVLLSSVIWYYVVLPVVSATALLKADRNMRSTKSTKIRFSEIDFESDSQLDSSDSHLSFTVLRVKVF